MARPLPTEGDAAFTNSIMRSIAATFAAAPGWFLPTMGLLFLANVILLVVVWNWQRWGVVGLVIVPLVQTLVIVNAGLPQSWAIGFAVLALLPVIVLIVLLTSGRPSAWSQMDG
jgi:hypothetical protein